MLTLQQELHELIAFFLSKSDRLSLGLVCRELRNIHPLPTMNFHQLCCIDGNVALFNWLQFKFDSAACAEISSLFGQLEILKNLDGYRIRDCARFAALKGHWNILEYLRDREDALVST